MAFVESVTAWIASLKDNETQAAQRLYERYFEQLLGLARKKLGNMARRVADEEDVAQAAINSFFLGVRQGRFPQLNDRHDLWQVLLLLTERKAIDQIRRQCSQKRRGEVGESAIMIQGEDGSRVGGVEQMVDHEPSPEFAAEVAEQLDRRLRSLEKEELREIALWKLEGYTNGEIAQKLGCVTRTVERRLELIRDLWQSQ